MTMTLRWPAPLTCPADFLATHWQRNAVLLPQALNVAPMLDANDLAGLATFDDVESTLIETQHENGNTTYKITNGPFSDAQLAALGERDWTLLLHDVDTHVPETAQLFDALDFLPSWRIDNLMVSVAAPGGSVGPHADSYDVMLLQGTGTRRWQLAPAGNGTRIADHPLRLRQDVTFEHSHDTRCGDLLYVPPGVIHHGVAQTLCTTWSLGMQAPLLSDLAMLADGRLQTKAKHSARYRDVALPARQRGEILRVDVEHLPIADTDPDALIIALGVLTTQVKAHLRTDPQATAPTMMRSPGSRLAWATTSDGVVVFANGQYLHTDPHAASAVVAVLSSGRWRGDDDDVTRWLASTGALMPVTETTTTGTGGTSYDRH